MPDFTTHVTDKGLPKLQAIVTRYNDNVGAKLTVADWLDLHVAELCISDDLTAAIQQLQQQQQTDAQAALEAAVTTARDELIASLGP